MGLVRVLHARRRNDYRPSSVYHYMAHHGSCQLRNGCSCNLRAEHTLTKLLFFQFIFHIHQYRSGKHNQYNVLPVVLVDTR